MEGLRGQSSTKGMTPGCEDRRGGRQTVASCANRPIDGLTSGAGHEQTTLVDVLRHGTRTGFGPRRVGATSRRRPAGRAGRAGTRRPGRPQTPPVVSPEVLADRRVTFRLAPQAQTVRLSAGDIPGIGQNNVLTRARTACGSSRSGRSSRGPIATPSTSTASTVLNPRSPITSESNTNVWSMVYVPGSRRWTRVRCPTALCDDSVLLDRAQARPPHARLHAAGL